MGYVEPCTQVWISNCIPQNTVGCNYLSLPEIPASGTKVLIYTHPTPWKLCMWNVNLGIGIMAQVILFSMYIICKSSIVFLFSKYLPYFTDVWSAISCVVQGRARWHTLAPAVKTKYDIPGIPVDYIIFSMESIEICCQEIKGQENIWLQL